MVARSVKTPPARQDGNAVNKTLASLCIAALAGLSACSGVPTKDNPSGINAADKATVNVEAQPDLCWSGSIGSATREGCGNGSFEIEGTSGIFVANAQKAPYLGQAGFPTDLSAIESLTASTTEPLTLVLVIKGKEIDRQTTSAQYGVVMVSNGK